MGKADWRSSLWGNVICSLTHALFTISLGIKCIEYLGKILCTKVLIIEGTQKPLITEDQAHQLSYTSVNMCDHYCEVIKRRRSAL